MNILIADSGSTKTTWAHVLKSGDKPAFVQTARTMGLNPLYTKPEQISQEFENVLREMGDIRPDAVFFYGAGCSGDRIKVVEKSLRLSLIKNSCHHCSVVEVASDLLGACRSLRSEICCILGTGSIAALYDEETDEMAPVSSLGYVLGDEGSGSWLGRHILSDYLKQQMPQKALAAFEEEFGVITEESAIEHVYRSPYPNRYLAQFAVFAGRHLDKNYCSGLVYRGISEFFNRNIMRLKPEPEDRISFVGSVAYNFKEIIQQVAEFHELKIGKILKEPIEGLIEFHTKQLCVQY